MRRWRTGALLVLVAVGTVAVYVWSFALSTTKDRPDELDTAPVRSAASAACAQLRAGVAAEPALPVGASTADRLARLAAQDRLIQDLVTAVRAVGPTRLAQDVPAEQWLADWQSIAGARSTYAAAGATGPFTPPVASGRPVSDRMGRVGLPGCTVPGALLTAP